MKKYYLSLIAIVIVAITSNAQFKLTSTSNVFVAGDKHEFVFANPANEGAAGKDVTWDFTKLQKTDKTLTTNMYLASVSDKSALIPQANVVIEEAGNYFFFKVSDKGMEQYGSSNNCAVTRYDKPMVKLKFPFKYGDIVTESFSGVVIGQNNNEVNVSGSVEIFADAYGTLLLPDGVTINNTTRVKQTRTFENSDNKEITYRWYAKGVRYPILVIIKYESAQSSHASLTAIYAQIGNIVPVNQEVAIVDDTDILNVVVSPNPFQGKLSVNYTTKKSGKVKIDLLDTNGKLIKNCFNGSVDSGIQTQTIIMDSDKVGTYFIRVSSGKNVVVKKVVQN